MRRRDVLAGAAGFAAILPFNQAAAQNPAGAEFRRLLDTMFDEGLALAPEEATELGLDKGLRRGMKSRLSIPDHADLSARRARTARNLKRLAALPRAQLSEADKVRFDTVVYVEKARARILNFDFVGLDGFSPSPYVISPITGAYQWIPNFLKTKHTVETDADADSYLDRMNGFARAIDANTERFRAAGADGVTPPDFLLDTTIAQLTAMNGPARDNGTVVHLAQRAKALGLDARYEDRAAEIFSKSVSPALARQIDALTKARASAGHDPGVWRFRQGAEFYSANLHFTTTTNLQPDEIHKMGLEQAREIGARLDVLLKSQGMSHGSVGRRIQAIYQDPAQFYANDEAGKKRLIEDLQARLDAVRARLPAMFNRLPTQAIETRAVPPEIDAGAPLAYSERPSLDGARPGYIYFNLHDVREWPRFNLPSTLYHESLPGHQLQGGLAMQTEDVPLLMKSYYFSGYGEGWALYAEQLADELGEYDHDPLGRIGWLKAQIFRAGRMVVDTGMHHLRWSRERAIAYMCELDGDAIGSTTREVDRYAAIPGQACSYKIGHTIWNRLRDRARAELGARFDIKTFHETGLGSGAVPLDVLDDLISEYIRKQRSRP